MKHSLRQSTQPRLISEALRLAICALGGILVFLFSYYCLRLPYAAELGLTFTMAAFTLSSIASLWPLSSHQTQSVARHEGYPHNFNEFVIITASTFSFLGVIWLQSLKPDSSRILSALVMLLGVFLSWAAIQLMYAIRYADMYYTALNPTADTPPEKIIDFNSEDLPSYKDFFYFSFNLGMTYQVSDTNVSTTSLRTVILRQSLVSYVFGVLIIGTVANIVMNLL